MAHPPAEAAFLLGVSLATIYNWMNAGKIPSVKIGSARRILRADIDRLLRGGDAEPDTAA